MNPILTGHSYMRVGSIHGGKMVLYPIAESSDGRQLVNWVVNIQSGKPEKNDWNKPGRIEDFLDHFKEAAFASLYRGDLCAQVAHRTIG